MCVSYYKQGTPTELVVMCVNCCKQGTPTELFMENLIIHYYHCACCICDVSPGGATCL